MARIFADNCLNSTIIVAKLLIWVGSVVDGVLGTADTPGCFIDLADRSPAACPIYGLLVLTKRSSLKPSHVHDPFSQHSQYGRLSSYEDPYN